jgi:outer membrane protein OmpA-like peptidoglycan-associated protein
LIAAYEAYVSAASGDDANARAAAEAAFLAECTRLGIPSLEECLAVMGGAPAPAPAPTEPAPAEQPVEQPPAEQPPAEQPAEQPPAEQPPAEAPAPGEQPVEQPPNVETPDAPVAPVLDSQKDPGAQPTEPPPEGQPAPEQPAEQPAEPAPVEPAPLPPPTTDQESQTAPPPTPEAIDAVVTEQGTVIETLPLEAPPNVEVINQTDDDRYVINIGINITIYTPYKDRDRVGRDAREVYYEELSNGRVRQIVIREDGTQVITVWNRYGEILQRVKILPDGQRIIIVYYDDTDRGDWRDPGDDLPPFVLPIPVTEYVIYSDQSDEEQLADFLDEPPLEVAARVYSIDEVKRSARIRDTVRRVEIGDITFDTGEATVERDQVGSLTTVAAAMKRLIDQNPSEVFLIEGHTDAVGSDEANLELSDRRAETIADLLVDIYGIPPENLTTQGYGEEYLKVLTEGPERANRRAAVRRITPLVASAENV